MQAMENAHALVIGIANYQHINRLPCTVLNDARDIYELLVDQGRCGYQRANVQELLDGNATLSAIRSGLTQLAQRCDEQAVVFIYLSGHGGRIENGPFAGEYLLPVDVDYTTDQSLAGSSISGEEFTARLAAISARKIVVVFDCCHAGGIGQAKDAKTSVLKAGLPDRYYEMIVQGRGRVILASSRSSESSYVMEGSTNSVFTEHVLNGLRGGVSGRDGFIRIFDLFEYVQPRVTAAQPKQHPIFKAYLEENFAIALRIGGEKSAATGESSGEFLFDAYISYAECEPDSVWVWETLVPLLERAELRIAVSGDVEAPGVARVVNIERGIKLAKRTVLVLSPAYFETTITEFENVLGQTLGLQEGTYRLLPIKIAPLHAISLPLRIAQLTMLDLTDARRADRAVNRLIEELKRPLERMGR